MITNNNKTKKTINTETRQGKERKRHSLLLETLHEIRRIRIIRHCISRSTSTSSSTFTHSDPKILRFFQTNSIARALSPPHKTRTASQSQRSLKSRPTLGPHHPLLPSKSPQNMVSPNTIPTKPTASNAAKATPPPEAQIESPRERRTKCRSESRCVGNSHLRFAALQWSRQASKASKTSHNPPVIASLLVRDDNEI